MICYDREYPESARILMLKGAELILVPNDCGAMAPRVQALSTRAYENTVGIVMANPNGENAGCSCAFSPICWDQASTTRCCWLTIKRKACSAQNLIWTRCGTTGKPR